MDVTKAPTTTDPASLGVGSAASPASTSSSRAAAGVSTASTVSTAPTAITAPGDRVDIQPLDVPAALQILIAEVRAELAGVAPPANTPPTLLTAELVASDAVTPTLETSKLVAANPVTPTLVAVEPPAVDLVMTERQGFVPVPSSPAGDVAAVLLPPSQPAGLALLESQAMPLVALPLAEPSAPPAPLPVTDAPMQIPLPELPGLGPDGFALWPQTSPGISPPGTDTGWGASEGPNPAPLPVVELPGAGLPVIPPSFDLGSLESVFVPPGVRLSSPAQAAPVLMRLFIQAVPEDAGSPAKWSATVTQLEVTLQAALDRAVATVEQWRNVPQVVVDAVRETRSLVMSQLSDEPPLPLWLRPEWMWLSPHMERFRRRRRLARRGVRDPDWWSPREDNLRQESPGKRREEP